MSQYPLPPTQPLTVLQINVGKGSSQYEIALSHAFSEKIDILLVQEPYIYRDLTRRITTRHPAYKCFTPIDDWTTERPRVLSYIRKQARLQTIQLCPLAADSPARPDTLFLHITNPAGATLLLVNAYNAPPGLIRPNETVNALTQLPVSLFLQPTLLVGDFNLHYLLWQPSYPYSQSAYAEQFTRWLDKIPLVLASQPDYSTYNLGNVLDLAFVSGQLSLAGTCTVVAYDLDATSDHSPLLTTIPWGERCLVPPGRLRPNTLDQPLFLSLLAEQLVGISYTRPTTQGDLDYNLHTKALQSVP
jgi:hypothetical protein